MIMRLITFVFSKDTVILGYLQINAQIFLRSLYLIPLFTTCCNLSFRDILA